MRRHNLPCLVLASSAVLFTSAVSAQQAELEEVVVTAERRAENLQTTPIAVSALGADDLERMQINSIADLDTSVPSLTVESNVASNASITVSMRGNAEQNAAVVFTEPGVGLYLNGVYRRLSGSNIELAEIERIEVLRGPQGTLFGRNTLAGAINIVTRTPSDTLAGSLHVGYGEYDSSRLRAAISGPIVGNWKGSISVLRTERSEGWATNVVNGEKVGTNEFMGAMGSLQYEVDGFDAVLSVYGSSSASDGPWNAPVNAATGSLLFSDRSRVAAASISVGGTTLDPFNDTDQHGADLVMTFDLGDWALKSTTSYSKMQDDWAVDFTAAQIAAPAPMSAFDAVPGTSGFFRFSVAEQDQLSQEFNLTRDGDRLDSILGAYWFKESGDQLIRDWFAGGFFAGIPADHHLESESLAVYAQFNYALNDRWSLVAGGRYNEDEHDFSGSSAGAAGTLVSFDQSRSFSRFSGKVGVEFKATDNLFSYLTFSQGYKAGSYDPFANGTIIANGLDEETDDSLELGLKAELLDRSLRLNTALFMVRYKDLAIGTITPTGIVLQNAGESEIKGVESELTWVATDRLRVFASAALQDSKWKSLSATALGVTLDDDPPFAFDVQASVGASYEFPIGSGGLTLATTARHIDSYFQQVAHQNNPLDRVDARDFLDASATFRSDDGQHKVALNVKNVTNEQGQYSTLNFSTFLFNNTAAWLSGEPRMWDLNYTYAFK